MNKLFFVDTDDTLRCLCLNFSVSSAVLNSQSTRRSILYHAKTKCCGTSRMISAEDLTLTNVPKNVREAVGNRPENVLPLRPYCLGFQCSCGNHFVEMKRTEVETKQALAKKCKNHSCEATRIVVDLKIVYEGTRRSYVRRENLRGGDEESLPVAEINGSLITLGQVRQTPEFMLPSFFSRSSPVVKLSDTLLPSAESSNAAKSVLAVQERFKTVVAARIIPSTTTLAKLRGNLTMENFLLSLARANLLIEREVDEWESLSQSVVLELEKAIDSLQYWSPCSAAVRLPQTTSAAPEGDIGECGDGLRNHRIFVSRQASGSRRAVKTLSCIFAMAYKFPADTSRETEVRRLFERISSIGIDTNSTNEDENEKRKTELCSCGIAILEILVPDKPGCRHFLLWFLSVSAMVTSHPSSTYTFASDAVLERILADILYIFRMISARLVLIEKETGARITSIVDCGVLGWAPVFRDVFYAISVCRSMQKKSYSGSSKSWTARQEGENTSEVVYMNPTGTIELTEHDIGRLVIRLAHSVEASLLEELQNVIADEASTLQISWVDLDCSRGQNDIKDALGFIRFARRRDDTTLQTLTYATNVSQLLQKESSQEQKRSLKTVLEQQTPSMLLAAALSGLPPRGTSAFAFVRRVTDGGTLTVRALNRHQLLLAETVTKTAERTLTPTIALHGLDILTTKALCVFMIVSEAIEPGGTLLFDKYNSASALREDCRYTSVMHLDAPLSLGDWRQCVGRMTNKVDGVTSVFEAVGDRLQKNVSDSMGHSLRTHRSFYCGSDQGQKATDACSIGARAWHDVIGIGSQLINESTVTQTVALGDDIRNQGGNALEVLKRCYKNIYNADPCSEHLRALEASQTGDDVQITLPCGSGKSSVALTMASAAASLGQPAAILAVTFRNAVLVSLQQECDKWNVPYLVLRVADAAQNLALIENAQFRPGLIIVSVDSFSNNSLFSAVSSACAKGTIRIGTVVLDEFQLCLTDSTFRPNVKCGYLLSFCKTRQICTMSATMTPHLLRATYTLLLKSPPRQHVLGGPPLRLDKVRIHIQRINVEASVAASTVANLALRRFNSERVYIVTLTRSQAETIADTLRQMKDRLSVTLVLGGDGSDASIHNAVTSDSPGFVVSTFVLATSLSPKRIDSIVMINATCLLDLVQMAARLGREKATFSEPKTIFYLRLPGWEQAFHGVGIEERERRLNDSLRSANATGPAREELKAILTGVGVEEWVNDCLSSPNKSAIELANNRFLPNVSNDGNGLNQTSRLVACGSRSQRPQAPPAASGIVPRPSDIAAKRSLAATSDLVSYGQRDRIQDSNKRRHITDSAVHEQRARSAVREQEVNRTFCGALSRKAKKACLLCGSSDCNGFTEQIRGTNGTASKNRMCPSWARLKGFRCNACGGLIKPYEGKPASDICDAVRSHNICRFFSLTNSPSLCTYCFLVDDDHYGRCPFLEDAVGVNHVDKTARNRVYFAIVFSYRNPGIRRRLSESHLFQADHFGTMKKFSCAVFGSGNNGDRTRHIAKVILDEFNHG